MTNISGRQRTPGAERFARFYRRQKMGRAVVQAEVDYGALVDFLIQRKFLHEWNATDRVAVQLAFAEWIEVETKYR